MTNTITLPVQTFGNGASTTILIHWEHYDQSKLIGITDCVYEVVTLLYDEQNDDVIIRYKSHGRNGWVNRTLNLKRGDYVVARPGTKRDALYRFEDENSAIEFARKWSKT